MLKLYFLHRKMICIFTPNEKWSYYDPNAPIHPAWSTNKIICLIVGTEIFPRYFLVKFVVLICIVLSIFYFASSPVLYVRAARLLFLCFWISLKRDLKETWKRGKAKGKSQIIRFAEFSGLSACLSPPFPASSLGAHEDGVGNSCGPAILSDGIENRLLCDNMIEYND